jgi:hypothetical protein
MAVTTESSTEYAQKTAPTIAGTLYPDQDDGVLRMDYFSFTQGAAAGDANSLVNLVSIPAGRVRIIGHLSFIRFAAFGASRTLDIGTMAYSEPDGDAVVAVVDNLLDGADVATAGTSVFTKNTSVLVNSVAGVGIQAKVLGGTIPAGTVMTGVIAYVRDAG